MDEYLYINRGTYVPASVCRGEAAATQRAAKPRPRGQAAALRARGLPRATRALRARFAAAARGKAAYNLVSL